MCKGDKILYFGLKTNAETDLLQTTQNNDETVSHAWLWGSVPERVQTGWSLGKGVKGLKV